MTSKLMISISLLVFLATIASISSNPAIGKKYDLMGGFDFLGVCLRNCAQCKKMYGNYFEGQLCADACVKFKGKIIPDCEDIGSIAPFLNKFE
ncbi:Eclosion hormone [Pseudolycoriella hygida]|uniref:Eclosion hormone n=1 Tax=Pseudolycoriella hygida TaxID=35572 RepID=A0A9Q0RYA3_9DIPT|nr:Eclosion hormone [Pseudolycoriella hygida]